MRLKMHRAYVIDSRLGARRRNVLPSHRCKTTEHLFWQAKVHAGWLMNRRPRLCASDLREVLWPNHRKTATMSQSDKQLPPPHPARWLLVILGAISINVGIGMVQLGYTPMIVSADSQLAKTLPVYLFVAGLMKMVFGMVLFARAKGRSSLWGVLGLFSLIPVFGLLIIVAIYTFLGDRRKPATQADDGKPPGVEPSTDGKT